MRTSLAICLALALMQGDQERPIDFVMRMVVEKSVLDRLIVREKYTYDRVGSRESEGDGDGISIDELFQVGRYRYEITDLTMLEGQPVYVVRFFSKPKRDQIKSLFSNFRSERRNDVLNCLTGTAYINPEDFGIIRVIARVSKPPESIWKVGRLYQMDVKLEQTKIDDVWTLKKITVVADYSYFLGLRRKRSNVQIETSNFRLKAP